MRLLVLVLGAVFSARVSAGPLRDCAAGLSVRPAKLVSVSAQSALTLVRQMRADLQKEIKTRPSSVPALPVKRSERPHWYSLWCQAATAERHFFAIQTKVEKLKKLEKDLQAPLADRHMHIFQIRGAAPIAAYFKDLENEHRALFSSVDPNFDPRREWWFGHIAEGVTSNFARVREQIEDAPGAAVYVEESFTNLAHNFISSFADGADRDRQKEAIRVEFAHADLIDAFVKNFDTKVSDEASAHDVNGTWDASLHFLAGVELEPVLDVIVQREKNKPRQL